MSPSSNEKNVLAAAAYGQGDSDRPIPLAEARPESIDAVLAKNLVVARSVAGMTQQDLATAADISRATIAQLETGSSDPRMSTVVQLAKALGISPLLLLIGAADAAALVDFPRRLATNRLSLSAQDIMRMQDYLESGLLKDRLRAAFVGAERVASTTPDPATPAARAATIGAAIFSGILAGAGTAAGSVVLNPVR